MKLYREVADVPEPKDVTAEKEAAFIEALRTLFEQYPPDDLESSLVCTGPEGAFHWRRKALYSSVASPQTTAYWAMHTGVPNDEIMAAYTLLFG